MYQVMLFLHVTTALIGFGQTFLYPFMLYYPKTGYQAQTVGGLISWMSKIAKYSDWILLGTGLYMITNTQIDFHAGWVNLSLILFVCMRISSSLVSRKTSKELWDVMEQLDTKELPLVFKEKRKAFIPRLWLTQSFNMGIIILMIMKPTIPFLSF